MRKVRNDLRCVLEEEEGSSIYYLISEVLEMAHDAHLLNQNLDPTILLSEIFNGNVT